MKICTINVPEAYIEAIEKLVGDGGLYPSRSELIRCAVREFLIKELELAKNINEYKNTPKIDLKPDEIRVPIMDHSDYKQYDHGRFIRVPEPKKHKIYKLIRRLK